MGLELQSFKDIPEVLGSTYTNVNLHSHTYYSDEILTPSKLVSRSVSNLLSITDYSKSYLLMPGLKTIWEMFDNYLYE